MSTFVSGNDDTFHRNKNRIKMSLPNVHGPAHGNPKTYTHFLDIVFLENLNMEFFLKMGRF